MKNFEALDAEKKEFESRDECFSVAHFWIFGQSELWTKY